MSISLPSTDKSFPFQLLSFFLESFFYHIPTLVRQFMIIHWDPQIFERKTSFFAAKKLSIVCYEFFSFSNTEQFILKEIDLEAG
jgi:hypothetical protein